MLLDTWISIEIDIYITVMGKKDVLIEEDEQVENPEFKGA